MSQNRTPHKAKNTVHQVMLASRDIVAHQAPQGGHNPDIPHTHTHAYTYTHHAHTHTHTHIRTRTHTHTHTQWRSQGGAHWGTCPTNLALCPTKIATNF